jgi:hypothetical protein
MFWEDDYSFDATKNIRFLHAVVGDPLSSYGGKIYQNLLIGHL